MLSKAHHFLLWQKARFRAELASGGGCGSAAFRREQNQIDEICLTRRS
jgi:hypothetical protein